MSIARTPRRDTGPLGRYFATLLRGLGTLLTKSILSTRWIRPILVVVSIMTGMSKVLAWLSRFMAASTMSLSLLALRMRQRRSEDSENNRGEMIPKDKQH